MPRDYQYNKLHFTERPHFSGYQSELENTKYILFGVPHDMTTSFRPGTRNGPAAIREASLNIETYSNFSKKDLSEIRIHDIGDIILTGTHMDKLKQTEAVLKQIRFWNKIPIMLGGEHSITIPIREIYDKNTLIIIFDAHGDLREEYLDEPFSHACVTKRLLDVMEHRQILQIGIRAQCLEEIEFVQNNKKITQLTSMDIHQNGVEWAIMELKNKIKTFEKIYISFDIDGYDPAYAPGTGTPEAMGLSPFQIFSLIHTIPNEKLIGIDLIEVNPIQDPSGITSILAAKTLFEILLTN